MPVTQVVVSVVGPVSTGKSLVLDRIAKMLKAEFDIDVVSPDLEQERNLRERDLDNPAQWEIDQVKQSIWLLEEVVRLPKS